MDYAWKYYFIERHCLSKIELGKFTTGRYLLSFFRIVVGLAPRSLKMKLPAFVYDYRRYFFPFLGSPCCEKMLPWLNPQAFHQFAHIVLAHKSTQTDLLIVVGRISHKQAPVLQHFYANMLHPNSVLHLEGCAAHIVDYTTMRRLDNVVPIDSVIDHCPITLEEIKASLKNLNKPTRT
jgi:NADH:ubiquinone oxidoreductase subunit B-like Fe-S oxidoreductase